MSDGTQDAQAVVVGWWVLEVSEDGFQQVGWAYATVEMAWAEAQERAANWPGRSYTVWRTVTAGTPNVR